MENGDTDNVFFSSNTMQQPAKLLDSFRHDAGLKRPATNTPKLGVAAKATCISFGVKSRYLVVGDDCGAVCLWDIKKRARVRHYFHPNEKHASLQATLDPTDSNVLSLSETALHIFRLREATLAASISESASRLTTYSTSSLQPTHVAIGTRIGSLDVYDMALQSQVLSMSPHTGSITAVQYSAVNKLLLASASTDASLCFSDTSSGNVVQRMSLTSPATCMAFHTNGSTCAVGTDSGQVFVYDLRNPSDIVASHQVDGKHVVSAVQFAPTGSSSTTASRPRQSAMPTSTKDATELEQVVDSVLNRSTKENKPFSSKTTLSLNEVRTIRFATLVKAAALVECSLKRIHFYLPDEIE